MDGKGSLNFLRGFVDLTAGTEIPAEFALWGGINAVSIALGRRSWLDMGVYVIYPNLYCVFVAPSGRWRKSTAINLCESIVANIEPTPNIISQKITPQALIEAIRVHHYDDAGHFGRETCEGVVIADELSNFLNRTSYDSGIGDLLTPFYDCKERFSYHTKARGKEELSNVCLGLLGGTTITWLRTAVPPQAVGDGVTSRMLFIYPTKLPDPVPRPSFNDEKKKLLEDLIRELQAIAQVSGEFSFQDSEAEEFFDLEYQHFYNDSDMYKNPNLAGYASRRHVHLLKLAMIFNICGTRDFRLSRRDLEGAKLVLEEAEVHMPKVLDLVVTTDDGDTNEQVLSIIRSAGLISRADLLKKVKHRLNADQLSKTMETLKIADEVEIESDGRSIIYRHKNGLS